MMIKDVFRIPGRGLLVRVDASDVPMGTLKLGILVHQGDQSWTISGVESACSGKNYNEIGLVLRGEGTPTVGELQL